MAALNAAGLAHRLHEVGHDPRAGSFGAEAAGLLGEDPARVFKTLVCDVDGRLAVAVVPVAGQVDLKALAAALGGRSARLAEASEAQRATGYVVGGISPLGQKRRLPTVVDESAGRWPTVFVSGGRRGLEIELAPADLISATGATTARIGR